MRLALFVAGLILALLGGFGIGRVVQAGPVLAPAPASVLPNAGGHVHAGAADDGHSHASGAGSGTDVRGVAISAGGYTLVPETTTFAAGAPQAFTFRVVGPDGVALTKYEVAHDKQLHLIVARRDLTAYQHLHPELGADGTWSVPLTLPTPGSYRAYADFATSDAAGRQVAATLAVDLAVPGEYRPEPLPATAREATVDGYTVAVEGAPHVGATHPLLARVTAPGPAGGPASLERYLGSYGHLVVLRVGDLAYLHVHPEEQLAGGAVKFWLAAPSSGRYRAFFDFQVGGTVHTASFTLEAT